MKRPLVILVLTYPNASYPHLTHLVKSNPDADIRLVVNRGSDKRDSWKNCDRALYQWWIANRQTVSPAARIVCLEQDVLVTAALPDIPTSGFAGAMIKATPDWYWWEQDAPKLPLQLQPFVCGLVPFAVMFTTPQAMDKVFNLANDYVFQLDVISEMRVGTLARAAGVPVEIAPLPGVQWHVVAPDLSDPEIRSWGIYHSIKHPVTL